jgi:hypothetical protein
MSERGKTPWLMGAAKKAVDTRLILLKTADQHKIFLRGWG